VRSASTLLIAVRGVRRWKFILFLVISIISIILFYVFRVKYFFLGDFSLRMEQIMRKEFLATEYLTMKMLYHLSVLAEGHGITTTRVFVIYSCILGGAFTFLSALLADLLGRDLFQKFSYFLAQMGTALLLVFCGYVEIYATPVVLLTLFIYSGLSYLHRGTKFYVVVIIFCLATASHLLSLALVPSLFVLWYLKSRTRDALTGRMSNMQIFAGTLVIAAIAITALFIAGNKFILPMSPPATIPDYMTFFSFRHFWEFINGQLLCAGLSFVLLFPFLWNILSKNIKLPGHISFLLVATAGIMFVVLIANLQRGSGDWDIMAFTAICQNLLAACLICFLYDHRPLLRNYLLMALTSLNLLNAFLWIEINHTNLSIRKIERMLTTDPGTYYSSRLPGIMQVMILYKSNDLEVETLKLGQYACNHVKNNDLKPCVLYAKELMLQKKYEQARISFENLMNKSPYIPEAYVYLLEYHDEKGHTDIVLRYLNKLYDSFTKQPDTFLKNIHTTPDTYVSLFKVLYKFELSKNNRVRCVQILATINKLQYLIKEHNEKKQKDGL
jgi:hypothetical protein